MDDQNKNLILATVLSFVVILVWYTVFAPPPGTDLTAPPPAASQQTSADQVATAPAETAPAASTGQIDPRTAPRVAIDTPRVRVRVRSCICCLYLPKATTRSLRLLSGISNI